MNKKIALITGSGAGLLYAIALFIFWKLGMGALAGFMTWYTYLPLIFLIIAGGAVWLRYNSITFDFKTALQYAVLAYFIFELLYAVANYSLFALVDREANSLVIQQLLDESVKKMKSAGANEDKINAAKAQAESMKGPLTFSQVLLGFGQNMILNFIKSIFIATITKQTKSTKA
ncbi:DUF4199 domain-containing protein [Flavihumibacter solisilvae]|uniref:DUF4199 domain-containing protein n=1 Tax=Flavihumibacter solisilvae TaxID=1349421 RepID=A0A0C1L2N5_9BACT|nr:DUF4199 domain-containing protein [Flavihumibacter solisilvae]KIC93856.1 hypothetical protein OI18_14800 [Flavihumibacter solisilvae]